MLVFAYKKGSNTTTFVRYFVRSYVQMQQCCKNNSKIF
jgi:hypothetical protein